MLKTRFNNSKANTEFAFSAPLRLCGKFRSGSTLLLVLAALLLSMILGLTYLEIVRMDRKSTRNLLSAGNIRRVHDAVRDQIAMRLLEDLGVQTIPGQSKYFE